ncbi:MAG: acetolactate decarboxylase [archaeon]
MNGNVKENKFWFTIVLVLVVLFLFVLYQFYLASQPTKGVLFQVSTFSALSQGVYDGVVSFSELKKHGDFGIGTFDSLDGEMFMNEGKMFQIKSDGIAYPVDDSLETPFASVVFFVPTKQFVFSDDINFSQFQERLDKELSTLNIPYAIRISGDFDYVKTRSVPRQQKPFPLLVEVVKNQPVFDFNNVSGIIVGYRLPDYFEKSNVPGYHLHFLDSDMNAGGHLINFNSKDIKVSVQFLNNFYLILPENSSFYDTNISKHSKEDTEFIEK